MVGVKLHRRKRCTSRKTRTVSYKFCRPFVLVWVVRFGGRRKRKYSPALVTALSTRPIERASVFEANSCNACHGDGGVGTAAAPKLIGIGNKYAPEALANIVSHPSAKMTAGGMPTVEFQAADLQTLTAYLESLK